MRLGIAFLPLALWAQLDRPLLDPKQATVEGQIYTGSRVRHFSMPASALEWDRTVARLRTDLLTKVVLRGKGQEWRKAERRVEWLDAIAGTGYRVRKFRYEAVPGLWIPGLLYEPAELRGKVPVVLNVNGHEAEGMSKPYIQERCINLAKRGLLAYNMEFLGRGQLKWDDYSHYRMQYLDLVGTSGLAPFYLSLEKSVDIALSHPNADPERLAVTGLSGGGWQTTLISALDPRIKLSVPVAGHSSYVTRAQWPDLDMGDSEQTPSDLASVADYLHLSAMMAPKPLLFINNEKDSCCFRADYAMTPLMQATRGVYSLYGALDKLSYYVNHAQGHNYNQDSREELYQFLAKQFGLSYSAAEIPSAAEVRTAEQLNVPLPENATFRSLALDIANGLPSREAVGREELAALVRFPQYDVAPKLVAEEGGTKYWRLRLGGSWTIPAVETGSGPTVIVLGDEGRGKLPAPQPGRRTIAIDLTGFGEAKMGKRDALFLMLIAGVGERPLGMLAGQLAAVAKWAGGKVEVESFGKRTGAIALIAGALAPDAIASLKPTGGLRSFRQIVEEGITGDQAPELFCFGLLERTDVGQIARLTNVKP